MNVARTIVCGAVVVAGCRADAPPPEPSSSATPATVTMLGSCCPATDSAIIATMGRFEATSPADRTPELAIFGYRTSSGLAERMRIVVRDSAEWPGLWDRIMGSHSPKAPVPKVDFASEMLVVAAMGTRATGGYTISIDSISARDTLTVYVLERRPGPRCGTTAALTAPVALARVTRTDRPVRFEEASRSVDCGP